MINWTYSPLFLYALQDIESKSNESCKEVFHSLQYVYSREQKEYRTVEIDD